MPAKRQGKRKPLLSRLIASYKYSGECWLWTGSLDTSGYGQITVDGRICQAHRLGYMIFIGSISPGMQLDHLCRNRACINPLHLEQVTSRENTMRGTGPSARNAGKAKCPKGHLYDTVQKDGYRRCLRCHRERMRRVRSAPKAF